MGITEEVEKFAERFYAKIDPNICGGMHHVNLVRKYALRLAEIEKANKRVIDIAAILHDIGKIKGRERHNEVSCELSKDFVYSLDIPEKEKELILRCILKHRVQFASENDEIEVKILQSADALGTLFDDKWQEYTRRTMSKEELLKTYDKALNKITLESARKLAEPKIKELKRMLD